MKRKNVKKYSEYRENADNYQWEMDVKINIVENGKIKEIRIKKNGDYKEAGNKRK